MIAIEVPIRGRKADRASFRVASSDLEELAGPLVAWLRDDLEDLAAGQVLRFGWYLLRLEPDESDGRRLQLEGPDMTGMPIRWTDDLSETVRGFYAQGITARRYGAAPEPPQLDETATVADGYDRAPRVMWREPAEPDAPVDSGWLLAASSPERPEQPLEPRNVRPISLYELAVECPELLSFMSMPFGSHIAFPVDGEPRVSIDGRQVPGRSS